MTAPELAKLISELIDDNGAANKVISVPTKRDQTIGVVDLEGRNVFVVLVANSQITPEVQL